MNIQIVAENLRNTIAGKQAMLDGLIASNKPGYEIIKTWLEDNIGELKRILTDVELCMNHADANSWVGEVDRQGGSFTVEELDPNRGWQ
jgi:hypothetical protein